MPSAKQAFSRAINEALRAYYGRVPSAAVTARDFNLRNHDTLPISEETARRWMRGLSLPEGDRMSVLVKWLGLDLNTIFGDTSKSAVFVPHDQQEVFNLINELNSAQLAGFEKSDFGWFFVEK